MAQLIGAQRMILQAILDLPKDAAGYVTDDRITRSTLIGPNEVRDWLETLEGKGLIQLARTQVGMSALLTAEGRIALRQSSGYDASSSAGERNDACDRRGHRWIASVRRNEQSFPMGVSYVDKARGPVWIVMKAYPLTTREGAPYLINKGIYKITFKFDYDCKDKCFAGVKVGDQQIRIDDRESDELDEDREWDAFDIELQTSSSEGEQVWLVVEGMHSRRCCNLKMRHDPNPPQD